MGKPGLLQSMRLQKAGHDLGTEQQKGTSILFSIVLAQFAFPPTVWECSLFSTISWSLFKFMSIESGILSNHLILCHPLSLCFQSFPES